MINIRVEVEDIIWDTSDGVQSQEDLPTAETLDIRISADTFSDEPWSTDYDQLADTVHTILEEEFGAYVSACVFEVAEVGVDPNSELLVVNRPDGYRWYIKQPKA